MTKLVTLYTRPDDVVEFDRRYLLEYLPRIRALPGVRRIEVAHIKGAPLGGAPYHLIEELWFTDEPAMHAACRSAAWQAALAVLEFARGLATTMYAEEMPEYG